VASRWRGKGRRRPMPWGQPGGGAKQRGGRGKLIPLLTLVGDGLWREIDSGGRSATETTRVALVVAMEGSGRRGIGRGGAGCPGEPRRPFYRRRKVGSGEDF
jgi:hypothetical protein